MGTSVEQLRTKAEGFIIQDIAIINWEVVAEKKRPSSRIYRRAHNSRSPKPRKRRIDFIASKTKKTPDMVKTETELKKNP